MKNQVLYPVIAKEYNDDGHYFVVTSPNVQGMVVEGDTLDEAIEESRIVAMSFCEPRS